MSQTYMSRRRAESGPAAQDAPRTGVPGPSMQELAAGAAPSREQMGRRVDLPEAIREKMEASFGADFSNVKLYESQTVADAGADAMAMGGAVGFAPGKLDFTSTAGQAMLGHELSHVVSQARGEAGGSGFLADAALEARADREGALAAAGESVYAGPVAPLSASAIPAAAAGVAQAVGKKDKVNIQRERNRRRQDGGGRTSDWKLWFQYNAEEARMRSEHLPTVKEAEKNRPLLRMPGQPANRSSGLVADHWNALNAVSPSVLAENKNDPRLLKRQPSELEQELMSTLQEKYENRGISMSHNIAKVDKNEFEIRGLNIARTLSNLPRLAEQQGRGKDELIGVYDDLMAPRVPNPAADADERMLRGLGEMKKVYYNELKRLKGKYGSRLTQMHPEDVLRQADMNLVNDIATFQDLEQLKTSGLLDMNDKDDQEFAQLTDYFNGAFMTIQMYSGVDGFDESMRELNKCDFDRIRGEAKENERAVFGSEDDENNTLTIGPEEMKVYRMDAHKRYKDTWRDLPL